MQELRYTQKNFTACLDQALASSSLLDPLIDRRVSSIIKRVRLEGDRALVELARRLDRVVMTVDQLSLPKRLPKVPRALQQALSSSRHNVEAFARASIRRDWETRNAQGGRVGEKFDPIQRVGIYVPGGTAPLVSTAIMTVALARVAGCRQIVVCTPPTTKPNAELLYAIWTAGATAVYQVGGAQAIAAMALGTKTVPRVNKIFGPGNAYVTAAKRQLFGQVGIDLLAGPSELLVIADQEASPRLIAADLLAQAEHGSGKERVWLVTTSRRLQTAVKKEMARQLPLCPRSAFIRRALSNGGVSVLVRSLGHAIELANRFAPEHLEIMTARPRQVARRITTAGAIFLGPWTPTVVGDYMAGPSHALPTGGAGAWFAGLTVDQFQRRTSMIELSRVALKQSLPTLETLGTVEGLTAHVKSARVRFQD